MLSANNSSAAEPTQATDAPEDEDITKMRKKLARIIADNKIIIFSETTCPECQLAKALLK